MFFDFNIPYDPANDGIKQSDRIRLILARFSELGESVIALNHTIEHVDPKKIQPIKPLTPATVKHSIVQLTRVTVETDEPLDSILIPTRIHVNTGIHRTPAR
ncbi:hypothetical protein BX666DRAFT_1164717 [Dichotomocladium elegans]|nr:hypothetical protein BX666DRAFT_1164717 [Dichotomocladium elegans]